MTGAEIKSLLDELGISTRQLAAKLDVPAPVVLAWQKEELFPTKRHVEAMRALRARITADLAPTPPELPSSTNTATPTNTATTTNAATTTNTATTANAATTTFEALADPTFWRLVRKLLAVPALRREAEEAAAKYQDPAETGANDTK